MGTYNDDFFRDFDGGSSDPRRDPQRRHPDRRVDRERPYNDRYVRDHGYDRNDGYRSDRGGYDSYRGGRGAGQRPARTERPYDYDSFDRDPFFDGYGEYGGAHPANGSRNGYDRGEGQHRSTRDSSRSSSGKRRRRPSRRVRRTLIVTVFVLVVLLLMTGIISIAVSVSGAGEVSSLTAAEVAADQVVLTWEKAARADGYRILSAKDGSGNFELNQTIDDPETLTATVTGLEQASLYSFSVTAFRGDKDGKPVKLDSIRTLPAAPEITNSYSADPGTVHLDWTANEKANGYIVEYKKDGGEYSADMTVTISDAAEAKTDITDLEVKADYQFRVYAYLTGDKQEKSAPSAEVTVTVAEKQTEVVPKAKDQTVDSTIDPDKPMIALTFDDGPAVEGDSGDRILDVLEKNNAKATFFMVGCNTGNCPDNLKRKVELKMEIGNHTWNHTHYGNEVSADDIRKASNEIYDVCGQYPTCFRSPGGMTTNTILSECAAEGMPAYYWSIDTQDWSSRNADAVYNSVMDNVKDGDIILMHEVYGSTADAVERMVPDLIAKGYQLVTCHDLIACKTGSDPTPGVQYVDAFRELAP